MSSTGTTVYTGRFEHTLDDKNRLTIPSAWRWTHADTETFLAMPHPDGYIAILPPARVAKMMVQVSEMKISDREAQAVKMRIFGNALSFTFDKQGRFSVNADLLRHAGIEVKDVILNGMGDTFNIMSSARWTALYGATDGEHFGDMMRRIGL
ncbi:division/cell wall cluster transcriptional repressor MraZ [Oleiharenicola lentus]|uniref:division/cell wall cluster transcriptional repressor MraZ n=1 Tax=Oleiharenicola lentus TaxID=2508720 RepID=UPI003F6633C6